MQSKRRSSTPKPSMPAVDAHGATSLLEGGALVLDVREHEEWAYGHAPGALHIPLGDLEARRSELPQQKKILVVCRSGLRSAAATQALVGAGFDATNLTGGLQAWAGSQLPVITDSGAPGVIV